jgi:hypothetical protein
LYFEPPSSSEDSDDSDNPDYRPLPFVTPYRIGSDESVRGCPPAFGNRNISLSNHSLTRQSPDILESDSSSTLSSNPSGFPEAEHLPAKA